MTKNYLLVVGILMLLLPLSVAGQELVWENTFDTPEERTGWTFYDGNNNSNTWNIGKHVVRNAATPNMYEEVSPDYVLRHSAYKPNVVGGPANLQDDYLNDFEDWVISPEIDLTTASGTITLAATIGRVITYNTTSASNNTSRNVFVYVSTQAKPVPGVADFQALRTDITTAYNNGVNVVPKLLSITNADYIAESNALFAQATADLSQYAGQKIYIGFWHNVNYSNNSASTSTQPFKDTNSSYTFQIDEMQVYAESLSVNIPVTGVSLNKTTLSLVTGTNETLTATVAPTDATNQEVTWSSSNEAVATVDATGKVTAVAVGTATITVTTTDESKTATCTVTVTAAIDYSWLKAATITVEGSIAKVVGPDADKFTKFYINDQAVELTAGQADLAGMTGELSLKATTADASGVIRLKISK